MNIIYNITTTIMRKILSIILLAVTVMAANAQSGEIENMKNFDPAPWVLPQPVLIIGTYNSDGTPNAMNAAWGGQWDRREIVISLSKHRTTDNIELNKEFTVAFATKGTLVGADYVGLVSGNETPNKVEKTGWTVEKSPLVNAPVFTDFPFTLECRVKQMITEEGRGGFYLVGEIVGIKARTDCLDDQGMPDVQKMGLVVYDAISHSYLEVGGKAGNAFSVGEGLVK